MCVYIHTHTHTYIYIYIKSFIIHDIISHGGTSSSIESLRIFFILSCPPTSAVHECVDSGMISGHWLSILFLKAILPGGFPLVARSQLRTVQDSALVLSVISHLGASLTVWWKALRRPGRRSWRGTKTPVTEITGLPWWLRGKESTCQFRRYEFDPWVRKTPLEKEMATHSTIRA